MFSCQTFTANARLQPSDGQATRRPDTRWRHRHPPLPASRSDRPKQFRSFGGDDSLLTQTVDRAGFADETYVLTREAYADERFTTTHLTPRY